MDTVLPRSKHPELTASAHCGLILHRRDFPKKKVSCMHCGLPIKLAVHAVEPLGDDKAENELLFTQELSP